MKNNFLNLSKILTPTIVVLVVTVIFNLNITITKNKITQKKNLNINSSTVFAKSKCGDGTLKSTTPCPVYHPSLFSHFTPKPCTGITKAGQSIQGMCTKKGCCKAMTYQSTSNAVKNCKAPDANTIFNGLKIITDLINNDDDNNNDDNNEDKAPKCLWAKVSPRTIKKGSSATVSWQAGSVDAGQVEWIEINGEKESAYSSYVVEPEVSTKYVVSLANENGVSECPEVGVIVKDPPICLTASSSSDTVDKFDEVAISWTPDETGGEVKWVKVNGIEVIDDTYIDYPEETTTYSVVLGNDDGRSNSCDVVVNVNADPVDEPIDDTTDDPNYIVGGSGTNIDHTSEYNGRRPLPQGSNIKTGRKHRTSIADWLANKYDIKNNSIKIQHTDTKGTIKHTDNNSQDVTDTFGTIDEEEEPFFSDDTNAGVTDHNVDNYGFWDRPNNPVTGGFNNYNDHSQSNNSDDAGGWWLTRFLQWLKETFCFWCD